MFSDGSIVHTSTSMAQFGQVMTLSYPRSVPAAAHNLMFNLGVATTQVCESVAVATQTLLARELGLKKAKVVLC